MSMEDKPEHPELPPLIPYDPEHPDEPAEDNSGMEDIEMTPELEAAVQSAVEAMFAEPFPRKPYALVPEGGKQFTGEYADYVIHKDIDTERQCVLIFDSVVDAFAVAEEYQKVTGKQAEPVECDIYSLDEDQFWLKYYRASGSLMLLPISEYKKNISLTRDY